jgi:tRNA modification GTPase
MAESADLILYVIDSSTMMDDNDVEIMRMLKGKKAIILLNKADLKAVVNVQTIVYNYVDNVDNSKSDKNGIPKILSISAKNQTGIEELEETIKEMFFQGELNFNDEVYITNVRHRQALEEVKSSLEQVLNSIRMSMPEDFYSIDLMNAYKELGKIIGKEVGEDLVNEIFSRFCTGK